jgi:hypothetical protein
MAQPRARTSQKRSPSQRTRSGTSRNGAGARAGAGSRSTRPRSESAGSGRSKKGTASSAAQSSAEPGSDNVAERVAAAVKKAKVPVIAGGAALAGLAGAAAVTARTRQRSVLGISIPKRSRFSLPHRNGFSMPDPNDFKTGTRRFTDAITDAAKPEGEQGCERRSKCQRNRQRGGEEELRALGAGM